MHPRLSVHSVCFSDAGTEALGEHWRALGATRVSLHMGNLPGGKTGAMRDMLDHGGQQVETITHLFHAGALLADTIEPDRASLSRTIAAAAVLGARSVYMLSGGRGALSWEAAADLFAQAVTPCLAEAREAGVELAIENVTPFHADLNIATSLRDTIRLAEIADLGICIDLFGCWSEAGLGDLIRGAAPRCVLVQASDYVAGDRALPCRAVPGDGAADWPAILAALAEAGYDGSFDLELIGPRIDAEGHRAAVARAAGTLGAMLDGGRDGQG